VGGWRRLYNAELVPFTKYYYGDQIKEDEMGGSCSMHGGDENARSMFVGKPEGKSPLGRPRSRLILIKLTYLLTHSMVKDII
jgi:hypothetical protein